MSSTQTLLSGTYLQGSNNSELVKRLKNVWELLQSLQQDSEEAQPEQLRPLAEELVSKKVLHHKSHDVQLLTACCIADIIRLYAPDSPYAEKDLVAVFSLFIAQLKGLELTEDVGFANRFYLLETLAMVNAFVMLADFDAEDMLLDVFASFFEMVRPEHSKKVVSHMLNVLATCLDACTTVNQSLLDCILENLLPAAKEETPAAYGLAYSLVERSSDRLRDSVSSFVNNVVVEGNTEASEVSKHVYTLIQTLFTIDSGMLLYAMPSLALSLKSGEVSEREVGVRMLGQLAAQPGSKMVTTYPEVFGEWCGRFVDKEARIRILMLAFTKHFLQNHPQHKGQVSNALKDRLCDPDEKVRIAAIDTVCDSRLHMATSVDAPLLQAVGERLRDKKLHVRLEAMKKLVAVYVKDSGHRFTETWTPEDEVALGWIPNKLMSTMYLKCDTTAVFLEKLLDGVVLASDDDEGADEGADDNGGMETEGGSSMQTDPLELRVIKLVDWYASLDDYGKSAMNHMLGKKAALASHMRAYLALRTAYLKKRHGRDEDDEDEDEDDEDDEGDEDTMDEDDAHTPEQRQAQANFEAVLKQVVELLPPANGGSSRSSSSSAQGLQLLDQLHSLRDNKIFKLLGVVCDPTATLQELQEARRSLASQLANAVSSKSALATYVGQLCTRASMTLVTRDAVPMLIQMLMECMSEEELKAHLDSGVAALHALVRHFPTLMQGHVGALADVLRSTQDKQVLGQVLSVVTQCGGVVNDNDRAALEEVLPELMQMGAPHAVTAVARVFGPTGMAKEMFHEEVERLVPELAVERLDDVRALPGILQTLGTIASEDMDTFEHFADDVVLFVVHDLMLKSHQHHGLDEEHKLSLDCRCKEAALRFLVNYVRPMHTLAEEDLDARLRPVFSSLLSTIGLGGVMTPGAEASIADKEHLRMVALECTLQLAEVKRFQAVMSQRLFVVLCSLAFDESEAVRTAMLEESNTRLVDIFKLPLRYMVITALLCGDRDMSIRTRAREYLRGQIERRRAYFDQRSESQTGGREVYVLPEYALPYLLYTLVDTTAYPGDLDEAERDLDAWKTVTSVLKAFLSELTAVNDNSQFVLSMLNTLRSAADAEGEVERTRRLRVLATIGQHLMTSMDPQKKWTIGTRYPSQIRLPVSLYQPGERFGSVQAKLPECFVNKRAASAARDTAKAKAASARRRSAGKGKRSRKGMEDSDEESSDREADDEEQYDDDDDDKDDASSPNKRVRGDNEQENTHAVRRSTRASRKVVAEPVLTFSDDEGQDEDEEDDKDDEESESSYDHGRSGSRRRVLRESRRTNVGRV